MANLTNEKTVRIQPEADGDGNATPGLTRRALLRYGVMGAALAATGGLGALLQGCTLQGRGRAAGVVRALQETFQPDVELLLRARPDRLQLRPAGPPTRVWRYEAELLQGPSDALEALPDTYLGPILRLRRGQRVRVRFQNEIPEETIVHWHGLHVPAVMDGHPRFAFGPGGEFVYEFEVLDRAGTYWFHPHPHRRTGPQVYMGLAGLLLVSDPQEEALGLPSGEFDVPLVLQDRTLDAGNQLVYGHGPGMGGMMGGGMMGNMQGFLGEEIWVNGRPDFELRVARHPYRLRVLNGSNSRIYKLAWGDGRPLTVIGTDGGLLPAPVSRPYVVLGPGERVELWADFRDDPVGTERELVSLPFEGGMGMMGGGMMGGGPTALPNGAFFRVLRVVVEREAPPGPMPELPLSLSAPERPSPGEAVNAGAPRRFALGMTPMLGWTINGRLFEMEGVAPDEVVRLGTTELWEFDNAGGPGGGMMGGRMGQMGSMMAMPHPMHVHGLQFAVVGRELADPAWGAAWESVRQGFVDEGLKDTVLVMPGTRARVALRFEDFEGLFLYHCHNLEHEDMGMMRNYLVRA